MKRFMGKALGMVLSVAMMVSFVPGMTVFAARDDGTGLTDGEVLELPEDVQAVIDQIEALPDVDELKLSDIDAVDDAYAAFGDLDEGGQSIVCEYFDVDDIDDFFDPYADKLDALCSEAILEVEKLIEAIPEDPTLDDEDTVKKAREAYDALPDDLKEGVENYDDLVSAEKKIEALKTAAEKAAADKAQVNLVIDMIKALPDPEKVIYDNYSDIQAAYNAYSDLGELKDNVGKELVDKLFADLLAAELLDLEDTVSIAEKFLNQYTGYLTDDQIAALKDGLEGANAVLAKESPVYDEVREANVTLIMAILDADEVISLHFTIIEGEDIVWLTNSDKSITIRIRQEGIYDWAYELFCDAGKTITIDGEALPEGAADFSKGSLIIEIMPDFLKTLSKGEHTLKVVFDNGVTMEIKFTIRDAAEVPASGESISSALYIGAAMLLLAGAGFVVSKRLAKKES